MSEGAPPARPRAGSPARAGSGLASAAARAADRAAEKLASPGGAAALCAAAAALVFAAFAAVLPFGSEGTFLLRGNTLHGPWIVLPAMACAVLPVLAARPDLAAPGAVVAVVLHAMVATPASMLALVDRPLAEGAAFAAGVSACSAVVLAATRLAIPWRFRPLSPETAMRASAALLVVTMAACVRAAGQNLSLAGLWEASAERALIGGFDAVTRYAFSLHHHAVAPLVFAAALARGRPLLAAAACVNYLPWYPVILSKTSVFLPAAMAALGLAASLRPRPLPPAAAVLALLAAAAAGGHALSLALPPTEAHALLGTRLFLVPGNALHVCLDFFGSNPPTLFAHVGPVRLFVDYPYTAPIPEMLHRAYGLGHYNANPWASDGVASPGPAGIPLVTAALALTVVAANTAGGAAGAAAALALAPAALRLADGSLFTTMWSGGMALVLVVLALTRAPAPAGGGRDAGRAGGWGG